jgi:uncharacterized protein (DUF2141 family)
MVNNKKHTKPTISLVDCQLKSGKICIEIHDGRPGFNRAAVISTAKTITSAKRKARRTLLRLIHVLENEEI